MDLKDKDVLIRVIDPLNPGCGCSLQIIDVRNGTTILFETHDNFDKALLRVTDLQGTR